MDDRSEIAVLNPGEMISAAITVRGGYVTEAQGLELAKPALNAWQRQQMVRLPEGHRFEFTDSFVDKLQGEHSVKRELTVVKIDEDQN
ncbi:hypothetical protein ACQZ46_02610 [Agrobacterium salinitolerans]